MRYIDCENKWIADNHVTRGTLLTVTSKATDYQDGWKDIWVKEMDHFVGLTGKYVASLPNGGGIILDFEEDSEYAFPYFVLQLVGHAPKNKPILRLPLS